MKVEPPTPYLKILFINGTRASSYHLCRPETVSCAYAGISGTQNAM